MKGNHASSFARLFAWISFVICSAAIAHAQQRPLITEDVDIIPPGSLRIEAGVDFVQKARFPGSGLTGDLTRAGVIGINVGLAPNVEFQIEGVAQNVLSINSRSASAIPLNLASNANSTSDIGDFTLWANMKLGNETRHAPSCGARLGVHVPSCTQARGFGRS